MAVAFLRVIDKPDEDVGTRAFDVCKAMADTLAEQQVGLMDAFNACIVLMDNIADQMAETDAQAGDPGRALLTLAACVEELAEHFGQQGMLLRADTGAVQ